ncbi:hypothetical protein [Fredinandcohnia quinoae]|uniref:hypothetical protein n=1 Tax=Fredinandcohnia quinoae TaxID=2918902 RepID=UPI001F052C01|nr:hypothetical protein [Fredinandcohnia sp. SECRCQ15]
MSKVTKIAIVDGSTGYQKTIEDNKVINDFLNDIKDIKFIPDENQESRSGLDYGISLHQNGEETFHFALTRVNGHYYHTEPAIYPIVDEFYTTLTIEED